MSSLAKRHFLLILVAALGAAISVAIAPGLISLLLIIAWSSALGAATESNPKNALLTTAAVLCNSAVFLLGTFFLLPENFMDIPFYPLAAASAYAFWCGNSINRKTAQSNGVLPLIFLGVLALFSAVAFSFLGNEEFGLYGRILIFGLGGIVLSKGKTSPGKQAVFLSPITILAVLQYFSEPSAQGWYLHGIMPLYAIISLILGNLMTRGRIWPKAVGAIGFAAGIGMIHWVFPTMLEKSTWMQAKVGTSLPSFELFGLDGDRLENSDIAQKVTWIEFYTSRCKPCIQQMASVQHVTEKFKGNDRVKFLSVSSSFFESHEAFLTAELFHKFDLWHGYEYDSALAGRYAPQGVPVGLLIDKYGTVRYEKHGFGKNDAPYFETALEARINALLSES